MSRLTATVIAALLVLLCCGTATQALLTDVPRGDKFVITESVAPQTTLTFQYSIPMSSNSLLVTISEGDNILETFPISSKRGTFNMSATKAARKMTVTFDNTNSRFSAAFVNFDLRHDVDFTTAGTNEQLDPIEVKVNQLSESMRKLMNFQQALRTQQKDHRATVEDANERVLLWAVFQVAVLIGMSLFQLFILKRFLEKKTFV